MDIEEQLVFFIRIRDKIYNDKKYQGRMRGPPHKIQGNLYKNINKET